MALSRSRPETLCAFPAPEPPTLPGLSALKPGIDSIKGELFRQNTLTGNHTADIRGKIATNFSVYQMSSLCAGGCLVEMRIPHLYRLRRTYARTSQNSSQRLAFGTLILGRGLGQRTSIKTIAIDTDFEYPNNARFWHSHSQRNIPSARAWRQIIELSRVLTDRPNTHARVETK